MSARSTAAATAGHRQPERIQSLRKVEDVSNSNHRRRRRRRGHLYLEPRDLGGELRVNTVFSPILPRSNRIELDLAPLCESLEAHLAARLQQPLCLHLRLRRLFREQIDLRMRLVIRRIGDRGRVR